MTCGEHHEFDFAISFAERDRSVAADLASALATRELAVFYDEFHQARLLGTRLDEKFRSIYAQGTNFFIPIVSRHYPKGPFSWLEWAIGRKEAANRRDFILPLRLDDTVLYGLPDTIAYVDLQKRTIDQVADLLTEKLRNSQRGGMRGKAPAHIEKWVATLGVNVDKLMSLETLPPSAPRDYPSLCDWLEADLIHRLELPVRNPTYSEASVRNGETLSVRLEFEWKPRGESLNFGDLDWWEILEVVPYEYVYETLES